MPVNHPARLVAMLVAGAIVASACSGNSKDSAKDSGSKTSRSTAAPASPSDRSAAGSATTDVSSPAAGSSAAGGRSDCDAAELEVKAATSAGGYVTGVKVIGGCTQVSVSTSLKSGPDGAAAATGICEVAASAAYAKGVGAVSVESADGKELAIGVKGSPCIGQP